MKKKLCLFGLLALMLGSCYNESSSANETNVVLPKSVIYEYSSSPGDNDVVSISYVGNKIVSAGYTQNDKQVYTYTGDFITKIEDFAEEGNISSTNEFTYENGKLKIDLLTEIGIQTYVSKSVYTYNTNGTISFITYSVDSNGIETKKSEGVLTYLDGNLTQKTEVYQGSSYTKTYEYDVKNNPFKNILGYNLLIDSETSTSLNNVTKLTYVSISNGNTTTTIFNSFYEYNEKDYPVKQTQTNSSNNDEITEYTY